jgi:hypothetical protein
MWYTVAHALFQHHRKAHRRCNNKYLPKLWLWLATAEVGQRPTAGAKHRNRLRVVQAVLKQWCKRSVAQHEVAELSRITSDVAKRMRSLQKKMSQSGKLYLTCFSTHLITNFFMLTGQQRYQLGQCT